MPRVKKNEVITLHAYPDLPVSDVYRNLRINIDFAAKNREIRTVAVLSAHPGEGKTITSLNLSVAYAQIGKKVLLMDADLRKPSAHSYLRMENGAGLTNLLAMPEKQLDEVVKATGIPNLYLLPAGRMASNASEMLASVRFGSLLEEAKQTFDVIVIDTSPALMLMDPKIVAAKCDGVVIVIGYRKVKRDDAMKLKEELDGVGANLLGVSFNKVSRKDAEMYYY